MKKLIFYSCLLLISISASAQVPGYVPTDSLKGWWAFNGNANDASGNGNNGVVNGATLTNDRFGNSNAAYFFTNNGIQNIQTNYAGVLGQNNRTISLWYKQEQITTINQQVLCGYGFGITAGQFSPTTLSGRIGLDVNNITRHYSLSIPNQWNHAVFVYETGNSITTIKVYLNSVLQTTAALTFGNQNTLLNTIAGTNFIINAASLQNMFIGSIDDIGIWNRALTQQEITSLYTQNYVAQIPSYIPSNGLVGYWPFNGNANDASGNGNNGTVNGATLSTDRFGINSAAYSFNGTSNYIEVQHNSSQLLSNKVSFSLWIFPLDYSTFNNQTRAPLGKRRTSTTSGIGFETVDGVGSCCGPQFYLNNNTSSGGLDYESSISLPNNSWTHLVGTYDGVVLKLYQNSVLLGTASGTINLSTTIQNLFFGREGSNTPQNYFKGIIDDIGFWNRALTQQEVTNLYNGNICFETVRVTDTLVINVNRTGYNPITYSNTIKVYPNPANNKITIDNGDIQKMNGYSIKIINSLGQQVYQGAITQQIVSIDITQWAGNGMYYLQLTDNNGNIVDVKKIVLQ